MEEIAFIVAPKAYEKWEFYSSYSDEQAAPDNLLYGCTFTDCFESFGNRLERIRHENFVHWFWRCGELTSNQRDECRRIRVKCEETFVRRESLLNHLRDSHSIEVTGSFEEFWETHRVSSNGDTRFWCGYCKRLVHSKFEDGPKDLDFLKHHDQCRRWRESQIIANQLKAQYPAFGGYIL